MCSSQTRWKATGRFSWQVTAGGYSCQTQLPYLAGRSSWRVQLPASTARSIWQANKETQGSVAEVRPLVYRGRCLTPKGGGQGRPCGPGGWDQSAQPSLGGALFCSLPEHKSLRFQVSSSVHCLRRSREWAPASLGLHCSGRQTVDRGACSLFPLLLCFRPLPTRATTSGPSQTCWPSSSCSAHPVPCPWSQREQRRPRGTDFTR